MRLLILSDVHIGARLLEWGDHAHARRREIRNAWSEAVDLAVDGPRKIDAVLIAGDLLDRPDPESEDWEAVREGLERLSDHEIPVLLLPGVFDGVYFPDSVYRRQALPDGVTLVTGSNPECFTLSIGDETLTVYSVAPHPGMDRPELITGTSGRSGVRVGLYHGRGTSSPESTGWLPTIDPSLLDDTDLDLIVVGGSHNFQEDRWGETRVLSPGTPVGLRPGEWDDRSWVIAEVTRDETRIHREPREAGMVKELELDLDKEKISSPSGLREYLVKEYAKSTAMLRLRLTGEVDRIWSDTELRKELSSLPFAVRLTNRTLHALDRGVVADLGNEDTVAASFVREIQSRISDAAEPSEEATIDGALRVGLQEFQEKGGAR